MRPGTLGPCPNRLQARHPSADANRTTRARPTARSLSSAISRSRTFSRPVRPPSSARPAAVTGTKRRAKSRCAGAGSEVIGRACTGITALSAVTHSSMSRGAPPVVGDGLAQAPDLRERPQYAGLQHGVTPAGPADRPHAVTREPDGERLGLTAHQRVSRAGKHVQRTALAVPGHRVGGEQHAGHAGRHLSRTIAERGTRSPAAPPSPLAISVPPPDPSAAISPLW